MGRAPRVKFHAVTDGPGSAATTGMPIPTISPDDLSRVTGGFDLEAALASPSSKMTGPVNPGGQVFENSHAGPSALERVNKSFDDSTRAMRTFNELGGALAQAPGFGRGDVLKP